MPEVNIIVRAKDEVSRTMRGIGTSLFGFNDTMMKAGLIGAGALGAVGLAAGKLAYDAAQVEPLKIAFEGLTESIGETADSMLDELRPATMGVLSDVDLMRAANKLMAMGLADSADEAARLAEMSTKLGMAMGTDATTSLENFTLMLANQSIPRLDTFGISSGKVRERIDELMSSVEGMTREQAFMVATMEQGEIALGKIGDSTDTSAVKMAELRAKMSNVKTELGEALLPALETLLEDLIIPLAETISEDLAPALAETLPGAIQATTSALQGLGDLLGSILEAFERLDKWTAEHWAPPELRGWGGRALAGQYATEAYGAHEAGMYGRRVEIAVHGIPDLNRYIEDAVRAEERHTVGP